MLTPARVETIGVKRFPYKLFCLKDEILLHAGLHWLLDYLRIF